MITSGKAAALIAAASILAGGAQAAPLTFDFTSAATGAINTTDDDTYDAASGSLSVNVKAYEDQPIAFDPAVTLTNQANVTRTNGLGLGVNSDPGRILDNPGDIDFEFLAGEGLLLTFSKKVRLVSVSFSNFDSDDDADVAFAIGSPAGLLLQDIAITSRNGSVATWMPTNVSGTQFFFAAVIDQLDGLPEDDFMLRSVSVEAIPEPGAVALLGLGVLGLAAARRRRG